MLGLHMISVPQMVAIGSGGVVILLAAVVAMLIFNNVY